MPRPPVKKPGPRDHDRYRTRGLAILARCTWQTWADALGLSLHTTKKYGTGKGRRFDPRDPASVLAYAVERSRKGR